MVQMLDVIVWDSVLLELFDVVGRSDAGGYGGGGGAVVVFGNGNVIV